MCRSLEHFAFTVFLFACVSHYVAEAEIRVHPTSLDSFNGTNQRAHTLAPWVSLAVAGVEHLRATSDYLSLPAENCHKLFDPQMKEEVCREKFVPLSQRFLKRIFEMCCTSSSFDNIVMQYLIVWESIRFIFMSRMRFGMRPILKNANTNLFLFCFLQSYSHRFVGPSDVEISNFYCERKRQNWEIFFCATSTLNMFKTKKESHIFCIMKEVVVIEK